MFRKLNYLLSYILLNFGLTAYAAESYDLRITVEQTEEVQGLWGGSTKFSNQVEILLRKVIQSRLRSREITTGVLSSSQWIEVNIEPGSDSESGYSVEINAYGSPNGIGSYHELAFYEDSWSTEDLGDQIVAATSLSKAIKQQFRQNKTEIKGHLRSLEGVKFPVMVNMEVVGADQELFETNKIKVDQLKPKIGQVFSVEVDAGAFPFTLELPEAGRSLQASLGLEPRTTSRGLDGNPVSKLCLRSVGEADKNAKLAILNCAPNANCKITNSEDVKQWVSDCSSPDNVSLIDSWRWPTIQLFPSAYAQPTKPKFADIWYAPTLNTLRSRQRRGDLVGVGYTLFTLSASGALPDADSFTYEVRVNGRAIHFGGVDPMSAPLDFEPEYGITVQFGLENVNFFGRDLGCDELEVALSFAKNDKTVGEPIILRRPYVALRDASDYTDPNWPIDVQWRGRYKQPSERWEYELFVGENNFSWVSPQDRHNVSEQRQQEVASQQKKREKDFTWLREWIGKRGFTDADGRRLVGVIRPPLTVKSRNDEGVSTLAYGIALGLENSRTGQVAFTFSPSERDQLRAHFIESFASMEASGNKNIKRFRNWLTGPNRWREYKIGSNNLQTPPEFCQSTNNSGVM